MKKLCTLLLLLSLTVSVFLACRNGQDGGDETTGQETDAVTTDALTTDETTKAPETEEPETLVADDGAVITDDALYGWFDYGSALYRRDDFTVGGDSSIAISMAKNEKEGFQYILASNRDFDDLRCEVSALTDGNGNSLEGDVYVAWNVFVRKAAPYTYSRGFVPSAILPQDHGFQGGSFDVIAGRSKTLYVQYSTDANTVPGVYTGRLEIKQGDEVILSGEVSVTVWDIYYEEKTANKVLFGVGYDKDNSGELSGPEAAPDFEDNPGLREAYEAFMLDNRLSPINMPLEGGLLNEKAAEYLDNPRISYIQISDTTNLALQYEKAEEMGWLDKVMFCQFDEPHEEWHMGHIKEGIVKTNRLFPTTNHMNAFYIDLPLDGQNTVERLAKYSTLHCAQLTVFEEGNEMMASLRKLQEERGDTVLWYVCGANQHDMIDILPFFSGTLKRTLFWQQYQYDVDGFLYWSITWWYGQQDIWEEGYDEVKHKLPNSTDGSTGNGVLLYWDPLDNSPVATLGFEAVRDGIEDYQLLAMAEEALGREAVLAYAARLSTSITEFSSDTELYMQVRNELAEAVLAANTQE